MLYKIITVQIPGDVTEGVEELYRVIVKEGFRVHTAGPFDLDGTKLVMALAPLEFKRVDCLAPDSLHVQVNAEEK